MVQGVSIISRRKAPQHVLPFLRALAEVLVGCDSVAQDALQRMQALSSAFQRQHTELVASSAPPEDDSGATAGKRGGMDSSNQEPLPNPVLPRLLLALQRRMGPRSHAVRGTGWSSSWLGSGGRQPPPWRTPSSKPAPTWPLHRRST